jgi:glycine dehydrogenase subunit 2
MPIPLVGKSEVGGTTVYDWLAEEDLPQSIGRLSGFMGNSGVLLRAYVYIRMLGRAGMQRVSEYATLNANYLAVRLREAGFELAFPSRRASHEFIVTLKREARTVNLTAMDMAKALLDKNYHAPTTYFPVLVPECLLIEPTETESKETLDNFVTAMIEIATAAKDEGVEFKDAPYTMPVRRLDDVKAARQLDLAYRREET